MNRTSYGFTLIELLVVIAIISILAAVLLPVVHVIWIQARVSASLTLIHNLAPALQNYMADTGEYPTDDGGNGSQNMVNCLRNTGPNAPYYNFKDRNLWPSGAANPHMIDEIGDMERVDGLPRSVVRYDRADPPLPDTSLKDQYKYDLWSMAGYGRIVSKDDAVIASWK